MVRIVEKFVRI